MDNTVDYIPTEVICLFFLPSFFLFNLHYKNTPSIEVWELLFWPLLAVFGGPRNAED